MNEDKKIIVLPAVPEQAQAIHDLMSKDVESDPEVLANKKKGFLTFSLLSQI